LELSQSKYEVPRKAVDFEDLEATFRGIARFLMHCVLDHICNLLGVDRPQFGVDHNLMGAFFTMGNESAPAFIDLERHGIPLYGILILEGTENGLAPSATIRDAQGIEQSGRSTEHPSQDDSLGIWLMKKAENVIRPSPWYVKANPVAPDNTLDEVYVALFGDAGPREVDSVMAGSLARVLGPASISSILTVPRPTPPPPPPLTPPYSPLSSPHPSVFSLDIAWDDVLQEFIGLDDDYEGSVAADEWDPAYHKRKALITSVQKDPNWDAVMTDLSTALIREPSAARDRILSIVQVAQNKYKHDRSALEKYVLTRWTERRHSEPIA